MSGTTSPSGERNAEPTSHAPVVHGPKDLARLGLGALGVVYGDIGTSPLYAIKECFAAGHGVDPSVGNVLGILSLVFWSLTLVITVKYVGFVLRADNHGDGGILALLALVTEQRSHPRAGESGRKRLFVLVSLGLIGFSLLLGEGMITPAISVLGALEGLDVATPIFRPFIVPMAVAILIALFLLQKRGTAGIGALFGPAMGVWFVSLAALGLPSIAAEPRVLVALDPRHAVAFFLANGLHGFLILGSVVLCVTGGEALYADLGHFGKKPIRFAWLAVVFPSLLINYFGQGALLLRHPGELIENPFFEMAPPMLLYPLVVLATFAAIIASQALISGAYSLSQQAMQLGYLPRLTIVHTSGEASGQIYVPEINRLLAVACVLLVIAFRTSSSLAAAYGISVMGTMMCTSVLLGRVARRRWRWAALPAVAMVIFFLAIEIPFFAANLPKIAHGGWFPIAMGSVFLAVATTWKRGRRLVQERILAGALPLDAFIADLEKRRPTRVTGTAVVLSSLLEITPPVLLHHFKHNRVLHERVVIVTVLTEGVPEVPAKERIEFGDLGQGFWRVVAHYGFMESPNVPEILRACARYGLEVKASAASYILGRETILPSGRSRMARWRKSLFIYLSRNARPANAFFDVPPNRVVELGAQIEL
jgi:KUP system potassium uptake protein